MTHTPVNPSMFQIEGNREVNINKAKGAVPVFYIVVGSYLIVC